MPRTNNTEEQTTATATVEAPTTPEAQPTAAPETTETKPAEEQAALKYPVGEAPDTFKLQGTIALRGDGQPQNAYNLLVLDPEAMHILDSLGLEFGAQVKNANGDYWIAVKAGNSAKTKFRQAKAFEVLVTAEVRITGQVNKQLRGELFNVTEAKPVTLRNGGRIVERQQRDRDDLEPAVVVASQTGGRSGMRSVLSNLR